MLAREVADGFWSMPPVDELDMEALEKVSFLTINEKRQIVGREPVPGGDQILIQSSQVGLEEDLTPLNLDQPQDELEDDTADADEEDE